MEKETLPEIESKIWNELTQAAKLKNQHFRNVIFSTIGIDNNPAARIIILRNVKKHLKSLEFFTDKRSDKYLEILKNPKVAMVLYDPENQIQLRINANAEIFNQDETALPVFGELSQHGKNLYGLEFPPGKKGEINIQEKATFSEKRAIENFCLIRTSVYAIDYLNLGKKYHKRAQFSYENTQLSSTNWTMP